MGHEKSSRKEGKNRWEELMKNVECKRPRSWLVQWFGFFVGFPFYYYLTGSLISAWLIIFSQIIIEFILRFFASFSGECLKK